jgi:hypothetical protein
MPYFYVRASPEVSLEINFGNQQSGPGAIIRLLIKASLFVHEKIWSKTSRLDEKNSDRNLKKPVNPSLMFGVSERAHPMA